MKDRRNLKSEYGYILRWENGGGDENGTWRYRFWLEGKDNIPVESKEALALIDKLTVNAFRGLQLYDAHVKLFEIMGIEPNIKFRSLMESYPMSTYRLAKLTGISQSLISYWVNGDRDPKVMSLENAKKVSQAFGMTLDELYDTL